MTEDIGRRYLIDSRTAEFIEDIDDSQYQVILRDVDYEVYGREGNIDVMAVNTEDRELEYFNFYIDSLPRGWGSIDVPRYKRNEEALGQLLDRNNWVYSSESRRMSREDVNYHPRLEGDRYSTSEADMDTVEQLLTDINSGKDLEDFQPIRL